jgi:hypothetical protein
MTRSNSDDTDLDVAEAAYEAWQMKRQEKLAQIEGIFAVTPAIRGDSRGEPRMAIKSGELSDRKYGPIRVTFFGPDGPYGHVTKKTDLEAAEAVLEFMSPPYSAMADADVMEWTTTPAFERGSRIIAIIQAENMLRYLGSKAGDKTSRDFAFEVIRARGDMQFDTASLDELDREAARLAAAINEMPRPNHRFSAFVANPAWVTGALADHYDVIADKVPPIWLPQIRHVEHDRNRLIASLTEYGCGAYGCVIATADTETVLKVTSDETESEFAATLANDLVAPICVEYRLVIRLSARRDGVPIHLLWREAADHVGRISDALGRTDPEKGELARRLIDTQHVAAQAAYAALVEERTPSVVRARLRLWLDSVKAWQQQRRVPELWPLAEGILKVWHEQHVLFGDIHAGNVGFVPRRRAWVITDPGNIAVLDDEGYYRV